MTSNHIDGVNPPSGSIYRLEIRGTLDPDLVERLGDLRVESEPRDFGETTYLTGTIRDQAQLLGILNSMYDLGVEILNVLSLVDHRVDDQPELRP